MYQCLYMHRQLKVAQKQYASIKRPTYSYANQLTTCDPVIVIPKTAQKTRFSFKIHLILYQTGDGREE